MQYEEWNGNEGFWPAEELQVEFEKSLGFDVGFFLVGVAVA